MEELRKKYENESTFRLKGLSENTQGKSHEIIIKILEERGVEIIPDITFEDDLLDLSMTIPNKAFPNKIIVPKINIPENGIDDSKNKPMCKKQNAEYKAAQFYMIYYEFLSEFESDTAIIAALLTSKQQYLQGRNKLKDGLFYLEHPKIEKMTGISEHRQKKAMGVLVELKILYISPKKKGTPPKTHYRVDIDRYNEIVQYLSNEKQSQ